jgi:hypothetical protein
MPPTIREIDGEERFKVVGIVAEKLFTGVFVRRGGTGQVVVVRASGLPTMYHVVNALAELPVIEASGASVIHSRGGKSSRGQRLLI